MSALPKLIAFYLPQFHPVPENDAWWGRGFTEWTNVTRARPLFPGHAQPHLPADLGFYDLRLPDTREAQAALAREHGLHGFCYYHYWFNGRRILERPFQEVLDSGRPDFPFCLCWANENWTRRWDGAERETLLAQQYSPEDDLAHIRWLARAFRDPRYLRVEGRPLFLVYRITRLPDPAATIQTWRAEARRLGVGELFLCNVENFDSEVGAAPALGLDAAVEFAPNWRLTPPRLVSLRLPELLSRMHARGPRWARLLRGTGLLSPGHLQHLVFDYEGLMRNSLRRPAPGYPLFRCVSPGWDNSARRAQVGALMLTGNTPARYQEWLARVCAETQSRLPETRQLVFVNAWNEWAEGCHLEPCQQWGRAWLEATRDALRSGGTRPAA